MKLHVAHFLERCTLNTLYNYHISSSCLTIELEAVSVCRPLHGDLSSSCILYTSQF